MMGKAAGADEKRLTHSLYGCMCQAPRRSTTACCTRSAWLSTTLHKCMLLSCLWLQAALELAVVAAIWRAIGHYTHTSMPMRSCRTSVVAKPTGITSHDGTPINAPCACCCPAAACPPGWPWWQPSGPLLSKRHIDACCAPHSDTS
jgi:hypothetical protein